MRQTILEQLKDASEEEYRIFTSKLLPNNSNILGVRLPILRKLAKEIAKDDWHSFLDTSGSGSEYFEEVMLQGMVIGYAKADIDEILKFTENFIPKIDNWSVCDSFCIGLKITLTNRDIVWGFIEKYLSSDKEFEVRFAVVMLIDYYIDKQHIHSVLDMLGNIRQDGYYVKMAVAWALSICFIKEREITMKFLKSCSLDSFTYNKALQKIVESNVIDKATKEMIRGMKIK